MITYSRHAFLLIVCSCSFVMDCFRSISKVNKQIYINEYIDKATTFDGGGSDQRNHKVIKTYFSPDLDDGIIMHSMNSCPEQLAIIDRNNNINRKRTDIFRNRLIISETRVTLNRLINIQ